MCRLYLVSTLVVLLLGAAYASLGCSNGSASASDNVGSAAIHGIDGTSISDDGTYRYVISTGVPQHETGQFPGPGNPNTISPQDYHFTMPLNPEQNASLTPLRLGTDFGVAINGVVFDPFANEFYNDLRFSGWELEPMKGGLGLDHSHAHVQNTGAYHYHGMPEGLIEEIHGGGKITLVGFAADGFPIYALYGYKDAEDKGSGIIELRSSYRLKEGLRPSGPTDPGGEYDGTYVEDFEYVEGLGDLDKANGRYGVTPEFPDGTYYYVLTEDYPYIPRYFVGTPDDSFRKGPPR